MQNYNQNSKFNFVEQQLIAAFIAMVPKIIASDSLIDVESILVEWARLLLIEAYKTKHAPRQWVSITFGFSTKWLLRHNI